MAAMCWMYMHNMELIKNFEKKLEYRRILSIYISNRLIDGKDKENEGFENR